MKFAATLIAATAGLLAGATADSSGLDNATVKTVSDIVPASSGAAHTTAAQPQTFEGPQYEYDEDFSSTDLYAFASERGRGARGRGSDGGRGRGVGRRQAVDVAVEEPALDTVGGRPSWAVRGGAGRGRGRGVGRRQAVDVAVEEPALDTVGGRPSWAVRGGAGRGRGSDGGRGRGVGRRRAVDVAVEEPALDTVGGRPSGAPVRGGAGRGRGRGVGRRRAVDVAVVDSVTPDCIFPAFPRCEVDWFKCTSFDVLEECTGDVNLSEVEVRLLCEDYCLDETLDEPMLKAGEICIGL